MSGGSTDAGTDNGDEDSYEVKPLIPPRAVTPQQAIFAIAFIFFLGLVLGFVLAQTV